MLKIIVTPILKNFDDFPIPINNHYQISNIFNFLRRNTFEIYSIQSKHGKLAQH